MSFERLNEICVSLGRRVCPIYKIDERGRKFQVGTGTLVTINHDFFLLTATHVINELPSGVLLIAGASQYIRFPASGTQFEHIQGVSVDVDVAAIYLPDEVVSELSQYYEFTTANEIDTVQAFDRLTLYIIVGYPHTKNKPKPQSLDHVTVRPYFVVLREPLDIRKLRKLEGKSDKVHFAFVTPLEKIKGINGQVRQMPILNGVSGGGVWKVTINPDTGNILPPRLVGTVIEHHLRLSAIVGTHIKYGLWAIQHVDT